MDVPLAATALVGESRRAKAWKELTDSEKIERMHDVVKGQSREIDRLRNENYRLRRHSHSPTGDLLVPYSDTGGGMAESQANPEAGPWF